MVGTYIKILSQTVVCSKQVFLTFLFSKCKMVDIVDTYKFLNFNKRTVMKNQEMLKLAHDHLKNQKNV